VVQTAKQASDSTLLSLRGVTSSTAIKWCTSSLAIEIQTLGTASMEVLAKAKKLEKQAALTTTTMREDIHYTTKLNTEHTDELNSLRQPTSEAGW
jgi:hypothetical protein